MYEEGKPCMISIVAYFPRYDGMPDDEYVEYYHGAIAVPDTFMKKFVERKQYIGQLELLAAVVAYYTLAEQLKDRKVVHMIDNQSAVAALIKGYSRAPDSVRIVHAFAAFNLVINVISWFEWVNTKANIADLPSRDDFGLLEKLGSQEVKLRLPDIAAWDEPADRWMQQAMPAAAAAGQSSHEQPRMGFVLLGNMKRQRPCAYDIKIDRTTALGNPFPIDCSGTATRDEVCEACDEVMSDPSQDAVQRAAAKRGWPPPSEANPGEAASARQRAIEACAQRVAQGYTIRLMCHCYPRRCHGEGLSKIIYQKAMMIKKEKKRRR